MASALRADGVLEHTVHASALLDARATRLVMLRVTHATRGWFTFLDAPLALALSARVSPADGESGHIGPTTNGVQTTVTGAHYSRAFFT